MFLDFRQSRISTCTKCDMLGTPTKTNLVEDELIFNCPLREKATVFSLISQGIFGKRRVKRNSKQSYGSSINFLFWLWILNKLIKVGYTYYFPLFYSIQNHSLYYFLNWNVLFKYFYEYYIWSSLTFFHSLNLNQLTFSYQCMNLSPLIMT